MEYSVFDLIRILLKKWYIILLVMAVIAASSVFLSRRSYEATVENYERVTTETLPSKIESSCLRQRIQVFFSLSKTLEDEWSRAHSSEFTQSGLNRVNLDNLESLLLQNRVNALPALAESDTLMQYVQLSIDALHLTEPADDTQPLSFSSHFSVSVSEPSHIALELRGLEESVSRQLAEIYIKCLSELLNTSSAITASTHLLSSNYMIETPYTATAQVAQTVMRKPAAPPSPLKVIGTAAAYSFVLACFGVLLYTFIKDTHRHEELSPHEAS